jgi:hypothetical protein
MPGVPGRAGSPSFPLGPLNYRRKLLGGNQSLDTNLPICRQLFSVGNPEFILRIKFSYPLHAVFTGLDEPGPL